MNINNTAQTCTTEKHQNSIGRGCFKIFLLLAGCSLGVFFLTQFIDDQSLEILKHNLSVGTIISLVIVINLVSFMCFTIMYFAYQWIKKDFKNKPDGTEDISDTPGS